MVMVIVSHLAIFYPSPLAHLPRPLLLPLLPLGVILTHHLHLHSTTKHVSSPCILLPAHLLLLYTQGNVVKAGAEAAWQS